MSKNRISRRSFLSGSTMAAIAFMLDWEKVSAGLSKTELKEKFPVVVIGAGLGGLCCGAYLAKQGIPVKVIEQHSIPGGYATSFDRAGGKFTFDVSLHRTSISSSKMQIMKDLGILDKIDLAKIPDTARIIAPHADIRIFNDPEKHVSRLSQQYPHETKGIHSYVSNMLAVFDEIEALKINGKPDNFPVQYPKLWKIRNQTLAEFIDDHVQDSGLKEILAFGWGAYGLPPSRLSAFFYAVAVAGYMRNGLYYIKNRSQDLSNALADAIGSHGGEILYETKVKKILIDDHAVCGVETDDGRRHKAKIVVSNASAMATFNKMLPPQTLSPEYANQVASYQPSISTFIVWLGLNRELNGTIDDARIIISSGRGHEADYISCLKGEIDKMSFSATIYDNYYNGYSTAGTSTISIICLSAYAPWRKFEAEYRKGRKNDYNREKDRWANVLIGKLEQKAIPGLSSMIEVKEAATPLTNWYYTGNTEGAVYGFEQSIQNSFMSRIKNRTPVKGLYLAGAWGNPGGGYGGAMRSGQTTFKQIIQNRANGDV